MLTRQTKFSIPNKMCIHYQDPYGCGKDDEFHTCCIEECTIIEVVFSDERAKYPTRKEQEEIDEKARMEALSKKEGEGKNCPKCHNVLAIIKKYGKEIGLCHVCDEEFDEHQYCFNCGGDYSRCDCTHEQFIKAKMKDIEGDCPSQYQTEESDGK